MGDTVDLGHLQSFVPSSRPGLVAGVSRCRAAMSAWGRSPALPPCNLCATLCNVRNMRNVHNVHTLRNRGSFVSEQLWPHPACSWRGKSWIFPSTGMVSPGRIRRISPLRISEAGITISFPQEYMLHYLVCDFADTVRWWMQHEQYSAEEISRFFFEAAPF